MTCPTFVLNSFTFPNPMFYYERQFKNILGIIKGVVVHSKILRDYMVLKTNTSDMINKYKILRPCTNLKPKNIKKFNNRSIDILFFEKYKIVKKQASFLIEIFRNYTNKNIVHITYGNYKRKDMEILANNSKLWGFCIYTSRRIGH